MKTPLDIILKRLYSFIDYEKLSGTHTYGTDLSDMERFAASLNELGNPQFSYKTIHVAGSKGKGSVCAMLESILRKAGYSTGLFTSPHLIDIRERIVINGRCIDEKPFADTLEGILSEAETSNAKRTFRTVFEIITATGFELFAQNGVDIGIIETGMGGTLDATNVLDPLCTVITTIGLDHTYILGNTVEEIAVQKAGIFKSGTPIILGIQEESVSKLLRGIAHNIGTGPILEIGKDITFDITENNEAGCRFDIEGPNYKYRDLRIPLHGLHQVENAAVAIAVIQLCKSLDYGISETALREGFANTFWPGRTQLFPGNPNFIVDGAHSPMAIVRLIETVYRIWPELKQVYLFSANQDKDIDGMLDAIKPHADGIVLTKFDWPRVFNPLDYEDYFSDTDLTLKIFDSPLKALEEANRMAAGNGLVIGCGSLYLAGELLKIKGYYPCEERCRL